MAQVAITPGSRPLFGVRLMPRRRPIESARTVEAADPRTTLAHIRVLEVALEEQVRRVAELTEELAVAQARPREDVRRMAATVEGLRIAFGKDPVAQRLLSRIDAALDRLVSPSELVRVPLPQPNSQPNSQPDDQTVFGRPSSGVPSAKAATTPGATSSTEAPAGETGSEAEGNATSEGDASRRVRVLPVPAEPAPVENARRRWNRR